MQKKTLVIQGQILLFMQDGQDGVMSTHLAYIYVQAYPYHPPQGLGSDDCLPAHVHLYENKTK